MTAGRLSSNGAAGGEPTDDGEPIDDGEPLDGGELLAPSDKNSTTAGRQWDGSGTTPTKAAA